MSKLYVVMYPDGSFAVGGGSSSPSYIRAFKTKKSAERSAARVSTGYPTFNQETKRYEYPDLGTPEAVEFAPVGDLKVKINNVLVLHGVDPTVYSKIMQILDEA